MCVSGSTVGPTVLLDPIVRVGAKSAPVDAKRVLRACLRFILFLGL